jgi:hypothetical protein
MIVSLITNDIGVAGATDWMAKAGHGSNKPSVNAVEPSFVQIMTSLEKGAAPIPPQMDMTDQGSGQSPIPQDIGSLDMAVTDEDSAQFLLVMVDSVGSAKVALNPQIAGTTAGIASVQAANGNAAGDDLSVALVLDAAAAFADQPSDFWGVVQITQADAEPVDPGMMSDQTIAFQPVVSGTPPVDPQQLALSLGDTTLPTTDLTVEAPNDDGTLVTAIDLGFDDIGPPFLDSTHLALDGSVDVPFTPMPVGSVFGSVKKMTLDDWKLTGEQLSYNASYQVVGMDAGLGVDPLSYPDATADTGVNVLKPGPLGLQGDLLNQPLNPVLKMGAGPGGLITVLTSAVNGADPQLGPLGPVAVDQSIGALPPTPQGQAGLSTPELSASVVRGQSADTAVPYTVSKPSADTDVTPLQIGPSGEAAGDVQEDAVTQQLATRAATATPGNGTASPNQADNKQEAGVAQQDVKMPDHAASALQVSKTAQLAAGGSLGAVQQVTVLRQPMSLTLGTDPLPPTMTLIDIASGGAGSASQGGSGQTGAGVTWQGAASLLGQMEAALDVRQQGWTKALVNRAINAAQAGGSLTIKILPAHLGQITLRLSEGKRGTDLRIIAEVPATASMLRDVQDQLSSAFESAGMTLGAYSASTGNNGGEGSQKDGYTDQVTSSELAIDAAQSADDVAGVDNLSRINILL